MIAKVVAAEANVSKKVRKPNFLIVAAIAQNATFQGLGDGFRDAFNAVSMTPSAHFDWRGRSG